MRRTGRSLQHRQNLARTLQQLNELRVLGNKLAHHIRLGSAAGWQALSTVSGEQWRGECQRCNAGHARYGYPAVRLFIRPVFKPASEHAPDIGSISHGPEVCAMCVAESLEGRW